MHSVEWLFRGIFRCTKERTGIPMGKAPESHETVINSNLPQTGDGDRRQEIVEELERVLHGKHFRNSGRAKQFLQFIVERKLDGHSDDLKERTLGTEVFNRPKTRAALPGGPGELPGPDRIAARILCS
jgi:hypothetical protein